MKNFGLYGNYTLTLGPTVSISASGTNTAGGTYSLMCSVTATSQPTITWLDDGVETAPDSSRTVSATTSVGDSGYSWTSTLILNPLLASYAGTYTCRATLSSGYSGGMSQVVTVQSKLYTRA